MARAGYTDELTEFYRQLQLLVRARLPLPRGVRGIAEGCDNAAFREVLTTVARDLERGVALSDAIRPHSRWFPPYHASLISSGEQSGALCEILGDVARLSQRLTRLGATLQEAVAYPFLVSWISGTIFLLLLRFYIPDFADGVRVLLETAPPALSGAVFALSELVVDLWKGILVVYVLLLIGLFWFISSARSARRAVQGLLRLLPGTGGLVRSLELSRLCAVWSVLIRRGRPLGEVLTVSVPLVGDPELVRGIEELQVECERGSSLRDCAALDRFPPLFATAMRTVNEEDLADELSAMDEHFRQDADTAQKYVQVCWQMAAFLIMSLISAVIILALFLPLIQLYEQVQVFT